MSGHHSWPALRDRRLKTLEDRERYERVRADLIAELEAERDADLEAMRWAAERIGDPYGWRLDRSIFRK